MSASVLSKPMNIARAALRRFSRAKDGIAAVEFGFVVPIMLCMFIGVVELSQAITVDRRVSHVASSTADLVARQKTLTPSTLDDYMTIIDQLMLPYSDTPLKMTISNVYNTTAAPTVHRVCWVYHRNSNSANGANTSLTAGGTYTGLPADVLDAAGGKSVIVVEVSYLYQPVLLFAASGTKVQGTQVNSFIGAAGINMTEKFYLAPRLSNSIQYNGGAACV
jgi:Flp pilus assembly protein TadG